MFREVNIGSQIEFISCGYQHMLAISRYNPLNHAVQDGKTYVWGKNTRGQLGLGNKITQYEPQKIQNQAERFKKVQCGANFSLGLSLTNRVYFWGNLKYSCNMK